LGRRAVGAFLDGARSLRGAARRCAHQCRGGANPSQRQSEIEHVKMEIVSQEVWRIELPAITILSCAPLQREAAAP